MKKQVIELRPFFVPGEYSILIGVAFNVGDINTKLVRSWKAILAAFIKDLHETLGDCVGECVYHASKDKRAKVLFEFLPEIGCAYRVELVNVCKEHLYEVGQMWLEASAEFGSSLGTPSGS